eukprot:8130838-Pyramimonas_sp.AAC.1
MLGTLLRQCSPVCSCACVRPAADAAPPGLNHLSRLRFQAKPSHTTRLPVERPDQCGPQLGIA